MYTFRATMLASAAALTFAPLPALAKSTFYIQLGTAADPIGAQAQWDKLKEDYPSQLAGLEYNPRNISTVSSDEISEVRIQAGPLRSRNQAQRLCGNLTGKGIDCFIVETAIMENEPAYAAAPLTPLAPLPEASPAASGQANDAPPAPEALKAPEPAPTSTSFIDLPWLTGNTEAKAEAPDAPAERDVQVAEAIRVPLTQETEPAREVPAPPAISESAEAALPVEAEPPPPERTRAQWIPVHGFMSEQAAYDFSQELHLHIADHGRLRMRISRPLFASAGMRSTSLTIGPVTDSQTTEKICNFTAQYDDRLRCGGDRADAMPARKGRTGITTLPPANPRESYQNRRASATPALAGGRQFWAQLGTWKSQGEAAKHWEEARRASGSALSSYSPRYQTPIRNSAFASPSVRLRVGPFPTRGAAEALCERLSSHGTACLTVRD